MLSLVLAASLAAAPTPRAATGAETIVHIPRLDALEGVTAFLDRAGQSAALMRPDAWFAELHPFFSLDPRQPDTLRRAGLDPAGALTLSLGTSSRTSCTHLSDPKLFQDRAAAALLSANPKLKEVKPTTSGGITTVLVAREQGGDIGYALKGQEACAFTSGGGGFIDDGQGALLRREAARLVGAAPRADSRLGSLPGAVYISVPGRGLALALDGSATELRLEGLATQLPLPAFQTPGPSPYGAMKPEALLFARARLTAAGMSDAMGAVRASIQRLCPDCPRADVASVSHAVAERLTGHVLAAVTGVRQRPDLRSPEGRFFATRQAFLAEVTDAAAMKAALAPLAKFPGARALADGYALDVKGGTLFLHSQGRHLVLSNDEAVAATLLASVPNEAVKLTHAVDFTLDPPRVAGALKQVSLMDVVSEKSLASIFTVGLELGPLLSRSERITGSLDSVPGGGHRVSTLWALPPTP